MPAPKTTRIWGDTIRQDRCRSRNCHRTIYFATNVRTGREMPFDVRPVAIEIQPELETNREMWTVDLAHNHFATCVDSPLFRRTRGAAHARR